MRNPQRREIRIFPSPPLQPPFVVLPRFVKPHARKFSVCICNARVSHLQGNEDEGVLGGRTNTRYVGGWQKVSSQSERGPD